MSFEMVEGVLNINATAIMTTAMAAVMLLIGYFVKNKVAVLAASRSPSDRGRSATPKWGRTWRRTPAPACCTHATAIMTTAMAAVMLLIGYFIKNKVGVLNKYCIPAPVVGGFLFMFISFAGHMSGTFAFNFDTLYQDPFMLAFWSCFTMSRRPRGPPMSTAEISPKVAAAAPTSFPCSNPSFTKSPP